VFRVAWADGSTAIVYRWHPDENRWGPPEGADVAGVSGRTAFLDAHRLLTSIGVRVPAMLHGDPGERGVDATAVVEDVGDRRLEDVLVGSAFERDRTLMAFDGELRTLHAQQRDEPGPLRLGSTGSQHRPPPSRTRSWREHDATSPRRDRTLRSVPSERGSRRCCTRHTTGSGPGSARRSSTASWDRTTSSSLPTASRA
jgi:hypothetical protein